MSGNKPSSRVSMRKDTRYATRILALEKGKRNNPIKEKDTPKPCKCLLKSENLKVSKQSQNSKQPAKKPNTKCISTKDLKRKASSSSTNHREKVVIVSKRSSSVSVVKSCNLRKSVSVKKVSYSTSVVLSSDEDTESEEEEEESEEEEEEEEKEYSTRRKTILKHTTSKVKSSVHESKKPENKSAKKAKAIKLLCDKLSSSKHKSLNSGRGLRPRFPYTIQQEWPTARTHRMASLNALAKVHVLYENEGRTVGENLNDADEGSLIDFINDHSDDDDDDVEIKIESKPYANVSVKKTEKMKNSEPEKPKNGRKDKTQPAKAKIPKKAKKRKFSDVEIIDTRICKRMASLNAQAILAASYVQEPKPKRIKKNHKSDVNEKEIPLECDLSIIKIEKLDEEEEFKAMQPLKKCDKPKVETIKRPAKDHVNKNKSIEKTVTNKTSAVEIQKKKIRSVESELSIVESESSRSRSVENSIVASTATTQVGVTKYTEVRKVQINTHKDNEIKEERKSERKIEQIVSSDDVAITQMYHYQSKSTNESYCVQMQATFKPASRNISPSTSRSSSASETFANEQVLPNNQNYYGRGSMLPPQPYPNVGASPPVVGHRIPRQYGSAFTVPHYRHPQPMQFPHNECGFYQPAGPLIQPPQDQRTIHKPVPYHPQPNPHQSPQRPQQPSSHRDRFQAFEARHSQQNKNTLPPQQKSAAQSAPPRIPANLHPPAPPQSTQFSRHRPTDDSRTKSLKVSTSTIPSPFHRHQPGDDSRTKSLNNNSSGIPSQFSRQQPGDDSRTKILNNNSSGIPSPFSRQQPEDDSLTKSLSSNPSGIPFNQPPKHVRSPVMPTLYSSQHNFRSYQTQKRVPNTFGNVSQPCEQKDQIPKNAGFDSQSSFGSSRISDKAPPQQLIHPPSGQNMPPKETLPHPSMKRSRDGNKDSSFPTNRNEVNWGL